MRHLLAIILFVALSSHNAHSEEPVDCSPVGSLRSGKYRTQVDCQGVGYVFVQEKSLVKNLKISFLDKKLNKQTHMIPVPDGVESSEFRRSTSLDELLKFDWVETYLEDKSIPTEGHTEFGLLSIGLDPMTAIFRDNNGADYIGEDGEKKVVLSAATESVSSTIERYGLYCMYTVAPSLSYTAKGHKCNTRDAVCYLSGKHVDDPGWRKVGIRCDPKDDKCPVSASECAAAEGNYEGGVEPVHKLPLTPIRPTEAPSGTAQ